MAKPPPLGVFRPAAPHGGSFHERGIPPSVFVGFTPPNRSSYSRDTTDTRSRTESGPRFLCRRKKFLAAHTNSLCWSIKNLQSGTRCPR